MLFWSYIKGRRRVIAAAAVAALLFVLLFALCEVPAAVSGYGAMLTCFFCALFAAADFHRFRGRYEQLEQFKRLVAERSVIPEYPIVADTLIEKEYQEVLRLLLAERQQLEMEQNDRYADMVEYYTTWAHQIKTPIAAMRLLLQSEEIPPAEELEEELRRIEQYVEMVMGFLRLSSESTDYQIRYCDLDGIVRSAVRKYASSFIRRKIRLNYEPLSCMVLTDEKWLSFVVEQVLSNALKYTKAGSISIVLEEPKTLCIRDTGIGILPEDLPRIFEKGYTGYNGRTDKKASGIGLYLCRQVCERLGHRIYAVSAPGQGTSVRIELNERNIQVE